MLFASNKYFGLVAIYCKWLVGDAVLGRKEEVRAPIFLPSVDFSGASVWLK